MTQSEDTPSCHNLAYLESVYAKFLRHPDAVDASWRAYFESMRDGENPPRDGLRRPSFAPPRPRPSPEPGRQIAGASPAPSSFEVAAQRLVEAYRRTAPRGALLDPLRDAIDRPAELDPQTHGLTEADLQRPFHLDSWSGDRPPLPLRDVIDILEGCYGGPLAVEAEHLDEPARRWVQSRLELPARTFTPSEDVQRHVLKRLIAAGVFERFTQGKYRGSKSFSLEGLDILIPALDRVLEEGAAQGIDDVVMGMAHRGRLNVLVNIVGKPASLIYAEFEDIDAAAFLGGGDVKYHLGASGEWTSRHGQQVHVSLCFNPSHLEFVNPVVLGRVRSRQDRRGDGERRRTLALIIHGDAGFAGEGIVQETFNLSRLDGYTIGGAVHIVLDNQLGFTTTAREGRSCAEATDVAKIFGAPVLHVHGESPEAALRAVALAMEFHSRWRRDVVIRLVGYRRHGHNEGDEPSFTQPVMYRKIREKQPLRTIYADRLARHDARIHELAEQVESDYRKELGQAHGEAREGNVDRRPSSATGTWEGYFGGPHDDADRVATHVERDRVVEVLEAAAELPEGFTPHRILKRAMKRRLEMASGERPLSWSAAELVALATLAVDGHRVRLSGQDSVRGTFSQRHAVLHDSETGATHDVFAHVVGRDGERVEIVNSPLSENGVLGFEYGYSLDCPRGLIAWEAQFGDFANAAQVYIDQFLSSAEDKWYRFSGMTLLLPHGFEGLGPEHSSARLERFLALSAEDSLQVAQPTTPAQYFHLLRRQVLRRWRKPLVVFTPKSLLRHPDCTSALESLSEGSFRPVLTRDEQENDIASKRYRKTLLCSGRIYYDLARRCRDEAIDDVRIVRLEELAPFPARELRRVIEAPRDPGRLVWVQDEPGNMGAWPFLVRLTRGKLFGERHLARVSRPGSSSPATGSGKASDMERDAILWAALQDGSPLERAGPEAAAGGGESRKNKNDDNTK